MSEAKVPAPAPKVSEEKVKEVAAKTLETTGAAPNTAVLKEEMKNRVEAAAERDTDVLAAEQRDHQRTMAQALGIPATMTEEDADELRKVAQARAEKLKSEATKPDPTSANNAPANWSIVPTSETDVRATNRITGEVYEGPAKDFLTKQA